MHINTTISAAHMVGLLLPRAQRRLSAHMRAVAAGADAASRLNGTHGQVERQQELLDLRLQLRDAVDDHSRRGKVGGGVILLVRARLQIIGYESLRTNIQVIS